MSFFRYPGGKHKLRNQIVSKLNEIDSRGREYREPFFGGGSIGSKFLQENNDLEGFWINDFDPGISCLWTALLKYPDELKNQVEQFKPSVEAFHSFKAELTSSFPKFNSKTIIEFGFKKLAIHQISYSGLGTKSGSPLGGQHQKSNYKIDCRWSPKYICKKIDLLHSAFVKFNIRDNQCTNLDFLELINDTKHKAIIYLDPPYFEKGNDLYQCGFTIQDHERLAKALRETDHHWVLSYDDCSQIRELYSWANVEEIKKVSYTITATKDKTTGERLSRTKGELLITKRS